MIVETVMTQTSFEVSEFLTTLERNREGNSQNLSNQLGSPLSMNDPQTDTTVDGFSHSPLTEPTPNTSSSPVSPIASQPTSPTIGEVPIADSSVAKSKDTKPAKKKPKRRRDRRVKGCTCKNSRCLKLYCDCYAKQIFCGIDCKCVQCANIDSPQFEEIRQEAIQNSLDRNNSAFFRSPIAIFSGIQRKGCKCKKSNCAKNYCECYGRGLGCLDTCRCETCLNSFGKKAPRKKRKLSATYAKPNNLLHYTSALNSQFLQVPNQGVTYSLSPAVSPVISPVSSPNFKTRGFQQRLLELQGYSMPTNSVTLVHPLESSPVSSPLPPRPEETPMYQFNPRRLSFNSTTDHDGSDEKSETEPSRRRRVTKPYIPPGYTIDKLRRVSVGSQENVAPECNYENFINVIQIGQADRLNPQLKV